MGNYDLPIYAAFLRNLALNVPESNSNEEFKKKMHIFIWIMLRLSRLMPKQPKLNGSQTDLREWGWMDFLWTNFNITRWLFCRLMAAAGRLKTITLRSSQMVWLSLPETPPWSCHIFFFKDEVLKPVWNYLRQILKTYIYFRCQDYVNIQSAQSFMVSIWKLFWALLLLISWALIVKPMFCLKKTQQFSPSEFYDKLLLKKVTSKTNWHKHWCHTFSHFSSNLH